MNLFLQLPAPLRGSLTQLLHAKPRTHAPDHDSDEDAIGLLADDEEKDETPRNPALKSPKARRLYVIIALTCLALVLLAVLISPAAKRSHIRPELVALEPHHEDDKWREDHFLHILLPTELGSLDLCRSIMAAAVTNQPSAWAIEPSYEPEEEEGDGKEDEREDSDGGHKRGAIQIQRDASGDTRARIVGVSKWLNNMQSWRDNDLVAVVTNPTTWFQVRPQVFLNRYYNILHRSDKQVQGNFSEKVLKEFDHKTNIIFTADNECTPTEHKCNPIPAEDGSLHYLNANIAIGPLAEIRRLWQRAARMTKNFDRRNATYDDNYIFSRILRNQERERESLRAHKSQYGLPIKHEKITRQYGISLDFFHELSYAADSGLQGMDWVQHPSQGHLVLPSDIKATIPPFWTVSGTIGAAASSTWSNVPLLTSVKHNIVPAAMHPTSPTSPSQPNTHPHLKTHNLEQTWWEKLWFQPYARQLMDSFALIPLMPLAILDRPDGTKMHFWSPHFEKIGVKTMDLKWHGWQEICAEEGYAEKLLLDGKGEWVDPHY